MTKFLTLIDADRTPAFKRLVGQCASLCGTDADWLSPSHAARIEACSGLDQALEAINNSGIQSVDHALTDGSLARVVLCDMDSTIIENECIDEIADVAGIGAEVAAITERAMQGELDFADALKERVGLLEGLNVSVFEEIIRDRIKVRPGAELFIKTMRKQGAVAGLVSGGFRYFTSRIGNKVGFAFDRSNTFEVRDGVLTGNVLPPIVGSAAKLSVLKETAASIDVPLQACMAVGDGANDIDMVQAAGMGVAFWAKPALKDKANIELNANNLDALLYVQGLRDSDFADIPR